MKRSHLACLLVVSMILGFTCVALAKDAIKIQTPLCDSVSCNFYCAPAAIGPYSQAIQYGELVFLSGQIALNPCGGDLFSKDIIKQTERVMQNLGAVLKAAGLTFKDVLSSTVYLSDVTNNFSKFNGVYGMYFSCNADPCIDFVDKEGQIIGTFCCDPQDPYCNKNCSNKALSPPARATVQAGIPRGGLLEVSMIAGK